MLKTGRVAGLVAAWMLALASSASAAVVQVGYEGVVQEVNPALAALLPPGTPVVLDAPVVVNFDFESTTPDTDPDNGSGVYTGAITNFTIAIGGQIFSHRVAGPKNEIDILIDPLLTIYQPVDSVVGVPELPGYPVLEADVIFIAAQASPLADDSLPLVAPDPVDPDWPTSEAALYDDMNMLLIDINLTSKCAGACPIVGVPVPVGGAPVLIGALAAAGFGLLAHTARRSRSD